jgi:hypothetical protein
MGITNQDWKKIELQLAPHRGVKLEADGYNILLSLVQLTAPTKFGILIYVNGEHQPRWITEESEMRRKFIYRKKKYTYPRKIRKEKEKYKAISVDVDDFYYVYSSFFPSFAAVKRHLQANCEKIEMVELCLRPI